MEYTQTITCRQYVGCITLPNVCPNIWLAHVVQGGYSVHLCFFICVVRFLGGPTYLIFPCLTFLDPRLLGHTQVHGTSTGGDADELRLLTTSDTFINLRAHGGSFDFLGAKVPTACRTIRGFSRSHTLSNVRSLRPLRRIRTLHENDSSVLFIGNHVQRPLLSQEHARCAFPTGLRVALSLFLASKCPPAHRRRHLRQELILDFVALALS